MVLYYAFAFFLLVLLSSFSLDTSLPQVMSGMGSSSRGGGGGWQFPSISSDYQQPYSPIIALNSE